MAYGDPALKLPFYRREREARMSAGSQDCGPRVYFFTLTTSVAKVFSAVSALLLVTSWR
jgi:hypothetical protein